MTSLLKGSLDVPSLSRLWMPCRTLPQRVAVLQCHSSCSLRPRLRTPCGPSRAPHPTMSCQTPASTSSTCEADPLSLRSLTVEQRAMELEPLTGFRWNSVCRPRHLLPPLSSRHTFRHLAACFHPSLLQHLHSLTP